MTSDIYQTGLKSLATSCIGGGKLTQPDASIVLDNPMCGDRITLEINISNQVITDIAHKVRGCILCKAAASIIAESAPNYDINALIDIELTLSKMLRNESDFEWQSPFQALSKLIKGNYISNSS